MTFEELDKLFLSPTIKPTFEKVHVILALYLFDENREGIGRYRLQKELVIGEGTARSLIKKLNEKIKFITVLDKKIRKGHVLTEAGVEYLKEIKSMIPVIKEVKTSILKEVIIEAEENYSFFCVIKNAFHNITNGVSQRDAAIKINGSGATCLVFNGKDLIFPSKSQSKIDSENERMTLSKNLSGYFESILLEEKIKLEENDVLAIGAGKSPQRARLATMNAALTLL